MIIIVGGTHMTSPHYRRPDTKSDTSSIIFYFAAHINVINNIGIVNYVNTQCFRQCLISAKKQGYNKIRDPLKVCASSRKIKGSGF